MIYDNQYIYIENAIMQLAAYLDISLYFFTCGNTDYQLDTKAEGIKIFELVDVKIPESAERSLALRTTLVVPEDKYEKLLKECLLALSRELWSRAND